jgi:hypothetical protein
VVLQLGGWALGYQLLTVKSKLVTNTFKKPRICEFYFSQLLNVHRVSDVRQIEIHTAEPLVPDPSPFEVEVAIAIGSFSGRAQLHE